MANNNEKEVIKTFLEWMQKNDWRASYGNNGRQYYSKSVKVGDTVTIDQLLVIYEEETKQFTVGEVWETSPAYHPTRYTWESLDSFFRQRVTDFAERYHELKTQNRIK